MPDTGSTGPDSRRNISRVPHFRFPATPAEQEASLLRNPLLARFQRSRAQLASDRYRPAYHYVNPENMLNDPNGLCYWQGMWHLFYQGYPPEDPRQHWGHAVSGDLIRWRDLPYAIYPSPERACYSGTTLVEDDRVIAFYHGNQAGTMVAVSSDPLLLNWHKLVDRAVIPIPETDAPYRVFDPCIWKNGDYYYSLSAGALPHAPSGRRTRAEFLFRSRNLLDWEFLHPFLEADIFGLPGDDGACPYFLPIGDRHILLHFSHMSGGKYLIGAYDTERNKFAVLNGGSFNFGAWGPGGVHAPSATPDGQGGVIAIFNMNEGMEHNGWGGVMTLPRRLTLAGADELSIEPAGDIEQLRGDHWRVGRTVLPANEEVVIPEVRSDTLELIAEIEPAATPMVELNVLRSPDRAELTRIAFFRQRGFCRWDNSAGFDIEPRLSRTESVISIDTSYSSLSGEARSRPPESASVLIADNEPLCLRVFVDRSIVEIYVNGLQCLAVRVYPTRGDSVTVSLRSQGQPTTLRRLEAWKMQSIYTRA